MRSAEKFLLVFFWRNSDITSDLSSGSLQVFPPMSLLFTKFSVCNAEFWRDPNLITFSSIFVIRQIFVPRLSLAGKKEVVERFDGIVVLRNYVPGTRNRSTIL